MVGTIRANYLLAQVLRPWDTLIMDETFGFSGSLVRRVAVRLVPGLGATCVKWLELELNLASMCAGSLSAFSLGFESPLGLVGAGMSVFFVNRM